MAMFFSSWWVVELEALTTGPCLNLLGLGYHGIFMDGSLEEILTHLTCQRKQQAYYYMGWGKIRVDDIDD